eukprot:14797934-Alexandrium_andersonii.AAC.1
MCIRDRCTPPVDHVAPSHPAARGPFDTAIFQPRDLCHERGAGEGESRARCCFHGATQAHLGRPKGARQLCRAGSPARRPASPGLRGAMLGEG